MQRFEQYVSATEDGLDFPLYEDIRSYGAGAFSVEELFETHDKTELYELEQDYITIHNGLSLRGYKIGQSADKPALAASKNQPKFDVKGLSTIEPPPKVPRKRKTVTKS